MADLDKARRALELIIEDAPTDAAEVDGMPFTGHSVGTHFGQLYAQVFALAKACTAILDEIEGR